MRTRLLKADEPLQTYRLSSYPEYLKRTTARVSWLRVDRVLGEMGINRDDAAGRQRFAQAMEERRGKDKPGEWKAMRRGWFLGGAQLKEQLLEKMAARLRAETVTTLDWIAERLKMGCRHTLANCLKD